MGKTGPCSHCAITYTPLWRNGPPEKPVLCNACGTRWRTRGTLENYNPLHSLPSSSSLDDHSNDLSSHINLNNIKVDGNGTNIRDQQDFPSNQSSGLPGSEFNTTNKSVSSASAISTTSKSCHEDGNRSSVLGFHIPSKKRSKTVHPILSTVEQLRRDLLKIQKEQENESKFSGSLEDNEDVLIYEKKNPAFSDDEIGLGVVLLKPPSVSSNEQKSEVVISDGTQENKSSTGERNGNSSSSSHVDGDEILASTKKPSQSTSSS